MEYKKIKNQIAAQTRDNLDFVKMDRSRGFSIANVPKPPTIPSSEEILVDRFVWEKEFYILDRSSTIDPVTGDDIFYHAVPVYSQAEYYERYPADRYGLDYFEFRGSVSEMPEFGVEQISAGSTGSFSDLNLLNKINARYSISIAGVEEEASIPITLKGNDISVSVWSVNESNTELFYTSGTSGLNGSISFEIPIGRESTNIYIFLYSHDIAITDLGPLDTVTDKFLEVALVLQDIVSQDGPTTNPDPINLTWRPIDPIVSSADVYTFNVTNKLYIVKDESKQWTGVDVYRTIYHTESVERNLSNPFEYGTVVIDTSDISLYVPGTSITIDGVTDKIVSSLYTYPNKIRNADFEQSRNVNDTGAAHWDKVSTSDGGGEAELRYSFYPDLTDYLYGSNCYTMRAEVTDTTKSCRIEYDESIQYYQSDTLTFYYNKMSRDVGALELVFYDSADVFLNTSLFTNLDSYSVESRFPVDEFSRTPWRLFKMSSAEGLNSLANKYYLAFYSCYQSTANSAYKLDGFHSGIDVVNSIYHSANATNVAIRLFGKYEKPPTARTGFNAYYNSNATDEINGLTALAEINPIYTSSSSWRSNEAMRFGSGVLLIDTATIGNSNPRPTGSFNHWSSAHGFNGSVVSEPYPWGGTGFARFTNTHSAVPTIYSYIQNSTTNASGLYNDKWVTCSTYLKNSYVDPNGVIGNRRIKLSLEDSGGAFTTYTYNLSSAWAKYEVTMQMSAVNSDTATAKITVPYYGGYQIDMAHLIIEPDKLSGLGLDVDNLLGWLSPQRVTYNDHSHDETFRSNNSTIRFWWSPILAGGQLRNAVSDPQFSGLLYLPDDSESSYRSIFYNHTAQKFTYRYYDGAAFTEVDVPYTNFPAMEPIHCVLTWDTTVSYLLINNVSSDPMAADTDYFPDQITLGWSPSEDTSRAANGIISGLRIDNFRWPNLDIQADYLGVKKSSNIGDDTVVVSDDFLGHKDIGHIRQDTITYIDQNNIEYDTLYEYRFQGTKPGTKSTFSEVKSITTRDPFASEEGHEHPQYGYWLENKIPNSSFEVYNNLGNNYPLYWTGTGTIDTDNYFDGFASMNILSCLTDFCSLDLSNGDRPFLSWYTKPNASNYDYSPFLKIFLYNARYELVLDGNLFATDLMGGFAGGYLTTTRATGADGDTWIRTSLHMTHTALSVNDYPGFPSLWNTIKYIKLRFNQNGGPQPYDSYLDAIQLEYDTVRAYRDAAFVGSGMIGEGMLNGSMIAADTLVGRHLYGGELIISGADPDANRILVGSQETGYNFVTIYPEYIRIGQVNANESMMKLTRDFLYIGAQDVTGNDNDGIPTDSFFVASATGIMIGKITGETNPFCNITSQHMLFAQEDKTKPFLEITNESFSIGKGNDELGISTAFVEITKDHFWIGKDTVGISTAFCEITKDYFWIGREDEDNAFCEITRNHIWLGIDGEREPFCSITATAFSLSRTGVATAFFKATASGISIGQAEGVDTAFLTLRPDRIIMGMQGTGHNYITMTPETFTYHPKGESDSFGWTHSKHVEFGQGIFGETQNFAAKGGREFIKVPNHIISPLDLLSFSTANWPKDVANILTSVYPQKVQLAVNVTKTDITVDAYIQSLKSNPQQTVDSITSGNTFTAGGSSSTRKLYVINSGATTDKAIYQLSETSGSNTATIDLIMRGNGDIYLPSYYYIIFYGTSNVIGSVPGSWTNWRNFGGVDDQFYDIPNDYSTKIKQMNVGNFSGIKTMGFHMGRGDGYPPSNCYASSFAITYYDDSTEITVLNSGADMGTYSYFCIDGGS